MIGDGIVGAQRGVTASFQIVSRDRYGNLLVSGGTPFELDIVPGRGG
jgi:hypothetical protein